MSRSGLGQIDGKIFMEIMHKWRECFMQVVQQRELAARLKTASQQGKRPWTAVMTETIMQTCTALGWQAAAKGYRGVALPVARSEYLNVDVMAFQMGPDKWKFPTAVLELENQPDDDYIAYNLWKLLCLQADLRLVYCYRPQAEMGRDLMQKLSDEVVGALRPEQRLALVGETAVVIGSNAAAETFPYGFFRWWVLEKNVGRLRPF